MASTSGRKRNVCPACGVRCGQVKTVNCKNPFLSKYRCSNCGHVHAKCELRLLTDEERAEAYERKKANHRKWYAEHRDYCVRYSQEYYRRPENRGRILRHHRDRYREDQEVRERKLRQAEEWYRSHAAEANEKSRRYYRNHREDILYKQKVKRLRELREERADGLDEAR